MRVTGDLRKTFKKLISLGVWLGEGAFTRRPKSRKIEKCYTCFLLTLFSLTLSVENVIINCYIYQHYYFVKN